MDIKKIKMGRIGALITIGILVFSLLLPLTVAQPPSPDEFYGELTLNGFPAPEGTELQARINDVARGNHTSEQIGYYGDEYGPYFDVIGTEDDVGEPIVFYMKLDEEWIEVNTTDPEDVTFSSGFGREEVTQHYTRGMPVTVTAPDHQVEEEQQNYTYEYVVSNEGDHKDNYTLDVSSSESNFTAEAPQYVTVDGEDSETVEVEVTIEEEADYGDSAEILLNATSKHEPYPSDEDSMIVTYEDVVTYDLTIDTDRESYDRGDTVEISGTAELDDGTPITYQTVHIEITRNGVPRVFNTQTDSEGKYHYNFTHSGGKGGEYTAEAILSYEGITERQETSFIVHALELEPQEIDLDMVPESEEDIQFTVSNIGSTSLTGISSEVKDEDLPDGITTTLETEEMEEDLAPYENTHFTLKVDVGQVDPQEFSFTVHVSTDQGSEQEGEVEVTLHPKEPKGEVDPEDIDVSLNPGSWTFEEISVRNEGKEKWEDIYLTSPELSWINIAQSREVGDLFPGEEKVLEIDISPPEDQPFGTYTDDFVIESSNHQDMSVDLTVKVTDASEGDILVHVVDQFGRDVNETKVTMTSMVNPGQSFTQTTGEDSSQTVFENLSIEPYELRADPAEHDAVTDTVLPEPGVKRTEKVEIEVDVVSKNLEVIETDEGETVYIELDLEFDTDIKPPALITSPRILEHSTRPGGTIPTQFKLRNVGLARVEDVQLETEGNLNMTLEPDEVGSVEAEEGEWIGIKINIPDEVKFGESFYDNITMEGTYTYVDDGEEKQGTAKTVLPVQVNIRPYGHLEIVPPAITQINTYDMEIWEDENLTELLSNKTKFYKFLDEYPENKTQSHIVRNVEEKPVWVSNDVRGIVFNEMQRYRDIIAYSLQAIMKEVLMGSITTVAGSLSPMVETGLTMFGAISNVKENLDMIRKQAVWENEGEPDEWRDNGFPDDWEKHLEEEWEEGEHYAIMSGEFGEDREKITEIKPGEYEPLDIWGIPEAPTAIDPLIPINHWEGEVIFQGVWEEEWTDRFDDKGHPYDIPVEVFEIGEYNVSIGGPGDGGGSWDSSETTSEPPEPRMNISVSPRTQNGLQGENLKYNVDVRTRGSVPDTYDLTFDSSWPAELEDQTISSKQRTELTVQIPEDAEHHDEDVVEITATGVNDNEWEDTSSVRAICSISPRVQLIPDEKEGYNPGDTINYDVDVKNLAGVSDTYSLNAESEWETEFEETSLEIEPGEVKTTELSVTIPDDAEYGDEEKITAEATSAITPSASDKNNSTARLVSVINLIPEERYGEREENLTYYAEVSNPHGSEEDFDLSVESNWSVDLWREKITLGPRASKFVGLTVELPEEGEIGDEEDVEIIAQFSEKEAKDTATAEITETITATAEIQISQEAVVERDAFIAELSITNDDIDPLEDVYMNFTVLDDEGNEVEDLFYISDPELTGIDRIDGNGTLDPGEDASAAWTLVPSLDAAGSEPEKYEVKAELNYNLAGHKQTWSGRESFEVHPQPEISLEYYMPGEIVKDVPFFLAVMAKNEGDGTAENLRIRSSFPEIIDNPSGIPLEFDIEGSWADGSYQEDDLKVDLGDIDPGGVSVGAWKMTSSMSGEISGFEGELNYTMVEGENNSVFKSIETNIIHHRGALIGDVNDVLHDLLADSKDDGVPDHILDMETGVSVSVSEVDGEIVKEPSIEDPVAEIEKETEEGWTYTAVSDPLNNAVNISEVLLLNSTEEMDSSRYWLEDGKIHLIDDGETTDYSIQYEDIDEVVVSVSPSEVSAAPGESAYFDISVKNMGDSQETFDLEATVDTEWNLEITPEELEIAEGETEMANLTVKIPTDVGELTEEKITVSATSDEISDSDSSSLQLTAPEGELEIKTLPSEINSGESFDLEVIAQDEDGNNFGGLTLEGFSVTSDKDDQVYFESTMTLDEEGRYLAEGIDDIITPGEHSVIVGAKGFTEDSEKLSVDPIELTFKVVDEDEEPIEGAHVELVGEEIKETDEDGNVSFEVASSEYEYIVGKEGYVTVEGKIEVPDHDVEEKVILYDHPEIETRKVENITTDSAKLYGEVTELGPEESVEAFFRYREKGDEAWMETDAQTMEEEKEFSYEVTGLDDDTEYEFKAVMDWEQDEEVGEIKTFITLQDPTFEVINLEIDPDEVYTDENFSVAAEVKNHGDVEGEYTVTFYEESKNIGEDTVDVPAGENRTASMEHSIDESGTYEISVHDPYEDEYLIQEVEVYDLPHVETDDATDITVDSAKLQGEVTEIGHEEEVEAFFRYREEGETDWIGTEKQVIEDEVEFDELIDDLYDNVTYEFKAIIEWDGKEDTGDVLEFTTLQDATFEVTDLTVEPDELYYDYEEFTAEADVYNHGDVEGDYTVEFEMNGEKIGEDTVTVPSEETVTAEIDYTPEEADTGERTVSVEDPYDGELTEDVYISEHPDVLTDSVEEEVYEAELYGEVEDIGLEAEVTAYFRWRETDETEWTETEEQTITEEEMFDELIDGLEDDTEYEFKAVMEWEHDEEVGEVMKFTTLKDATFRLDNLVVDPAEVYVDSEFNIEVEVENVGDIEGEYTADFYKEGDWIGEDTVEVSAGDTKIASITHSIAETGIYEISVEDLTAEVTVSYYPAVETNPASDVETESAVLQGDVVEIGLNDEVDAYFRYRELGEESWIETPVQTLTAEQDFEEEIIGLDDDKTYEFKAVIEWNGEENLGEILEFTTLKSATFEVDIDYPTEGDEILEGERVTVEFTVENTGDLEGTQTIVFRVNDDEEDTMEMTIRSGESEDGEFEWEVEDDEDYELEVASEDTSDSVMVTVEEEEEDGWLEIPGYTLAILLSAVFIAVAIYKKKKW